MPLDRHIQSQIPRQPEAPGQGSFVEPLPRAGGNFEIYRQKLTNLHKLLLNMWSDRHIQSQIPRQPEAPG